MLATPGKMKAPLGNYLCKEKILWFVIDMYCVKNTVKDYPGSVYLFLLCGWGRGVYNRSADNRKETGLERREVFIFLIITLS